MLRDTINGLVATYARNMDHIEQCPNCREVDNVTHLVATLVEGMNPLNMAAVVAVAVKTLYDERAGRTTMDSLPSPGSIAD